MATRNTLSSLFKEYSIRGLICQGKSYTRMIPWVLRKFFPDFIPVPTIHGEGIGIDREFLSIGAVIFGGLIPEIERVAGFFPAMATEGFGAFPSPHIFDCNETHVSFLIFDEFPKRNQSSYAHHSTFRGCCQGDSTRGFVLRSDGQRCGGGHRRGRLGAWGLP